MLKTLKNLVYISFITKSFVIFSFNFYLTPKLDFYMKHFSVLLISFCLSFTVLAQTPNRISIKGVVRDTSGTEMAFPTVMLLSPKDSSLVNFSRASEKGTFEFKGVKNAKYLLKVSYTGYFPLQVPIGPFETETADLGAVKIKTISKELMEIVVRTAKAPLTIRGDTIEYDATTFKVPPGSTVEDLLRRLPGIQLDAAGNIKAQGKDVKNVYVDGKVFFGGDAKAATKNLGAETISKVQVFDEKSEQAKLTGVDDGKKEKAVNLELKEEFKKGAFGKMTLAAGTESRLAARGNYNRFNKTTQFSIIGYGNNINETGVNWDDYGEFKGNNSWNWDNDNFGFSSGNNIIYMNDDTRGGVPTSNFDGRGFTNNAGSGVNYNYNHKKTKLSSSYFYNQTRLSLDQYVNKQTFRQDGSFFNKDSTDKVDFRNNHRVNFRWEEMVDSSNTIISKADVRFSNSTVFENQSQQFLSDATTLQNRLGINNTNAFNSYGLSASMVFRHKYRKSKVKGRNFAASAGVNLSGSDGTETLFSLNRFFEATTVTEQIRSQRNSNESSSQLIKASMSYLEPLAKKFYWESFYNFSINTQDVGRGAFNKLEQERRVDSLSTFFTNRVVYNRLGSSFRYSNAGVNISVGLAAQNNDLGGIQSLEKNSRVLKNINKSFFAWTPNVNASIEFKNNMYMNAGYNYGQVVPKLTDLQPVVNNNNPFYIIEGNPDLSAERSHALNLSINKFDPSSFAYVNFGLNYSAYENQIVYTQTIDKNFVTKSRPENISGGKNLNGYVYASFPIVKTKLTFNTNGNISIGNSPTFINGIKNESDNRTYRYTAGFSFTPEGSKLILDASANFSITNISYSLATQQNQKILNQGIDASMKWNFAKKFFLETNLDYNSYQNDRFNFNQTIPVWNASVRRLLTKDNKLEIRLAAFDLLNRRVSVRQNAGINTVTQEIAPTLARYFMLSLSYNMRGYQTKLKKNDW
jgi:Outer membrane protein beta-barrel family